MKTILNNNQLQFLNQFKKDDYLTKTFYLTGGTALAEYYLGHRLSEDLDFFCPNRFNIDYIDQFINKFKKKVKAVKVERNRIFDRHIYIITYENSLLKVEFVIFEHKNIKPLQNKNNLMINDGYDITVNKLFTIEDRFEIKDYVDLYFLLQKYPLNKIRADVEAKFGFVFDDITLGALFMRVEKTTILPKMIKPLTKNELVEFFRNQAKGLKNEIFSQSK